MTKRVTVFVNRTPAPPAWETALPSIGEATPHTVLMDVHDEAGEYTLTLREQAARPTEDVALPAQQSRHSDNPARQQTPSSEPSVVRHLLPIGYALGPDTLLVAGQYRLINQTDGNLVLYGPDGPLWHTDTIGDNGSLVMQDDGNLVLYSASGAPVWHSGTMGTDARYLALDEHGHLGLHNESDELLWSCPRC